MVQILELFGGIGSPRCALRNIGIPVKAIDYVEIDEKAVRSYNAMFSDELEYKTQSVACVAGLILFFVFIWWRGQHTYPQTDKEAAVQRQQAEPLVIETPEPATEGSIRVYDYDGCCIYAYYGEIKINSDGRDGKQIDIECAGYLEGYQQHGVHESEVRE